MKYEVKSNISILEWGIMLEFVNIFVVGNGDSDGDGDVELQHLVLNVN